MREKLIRFMYGRYGADRLSKHMVVAGFVLSILSMFSGRWYMLGNLLYLLSMTLFILGCVRVFSKNHTKRYQELCKYEKFLAKWRGGPTRWKQEFQEKSKYRIFRCPNCRQKLRVPRGRGQIEIRCRKCQTVFRKRS